MKNFDPISLFTEKIKVDLRKVKDFIIGGKYACVVLKNGNIGLAANILNVDNFDFKNADLSDIQNNTNRLFLLAYVNAVLNNNKLSARKDDIFEVIDFKKYKKIVMIGYSEPMYIKLLKINIKPFVFDFNSNEKFIVKQDLLKAYLREANSVILTGTSLINNTFGDIIKEVKSDCSVFLIGPSVPLWEDLFDYCGIAGVFGTIFDQNKDIVIDLIKKNEGTNCLKKYGTKVGLLRN